MTTLVVPDLHQDLPWLERVLDQNHDADRIVFLGDYADSFKPPANLRRVMERLVDLAEQRDCTFLAGNHDLPYLWVVRRHGPKTNAYPKGSTHFPLNCPGYSKSRAKDFYKGTTPAWRASLQLVTTVPSDGDEPWLLSHAGVPASLIPPVVDDWLGALEHDTKRALDNVLAAPDHPYFWCGPDRGGTDPRGGLVWQDISQFEDSLPTPQVFGHTPNHGVRRINRSYCVDCGQRGYTRITDGVISFHPAR